MKSKFVKIGTGKVFKSKRNRKHILLSFNIKKLKQMSPQDLENVFCFKTENDYVLMVNL